MTTSVSVSNVFFSTEVKHCHNVECMHLCKSISLFSIQNKYELILIYIYVTYFSFILVLFTLPIVYSMGKMHGYRAIIFKY